MSTEQIHNDEAFKKTLQQTIKKLFNTAYGILYDAKMESGALSTSTAALSNSILKCLGEGDILFASALVHCQTLIIAAIANGRHEHGDTAPWSLVQRSALADFATQGRKLLEEFETDDVIHQVRE